LSVAYNNEIESKHGVQHMMTWVLIVVMAVSHNPGMQPYVGGGVFSVPGFHSELGCQEAQAKVAQGAAKIYGRYADASISLSCIQQ
jgi:hypothetical protein